MSIEEIGADPGYREAIAIVGIGCRLPLANNVDEFWRLLANGTDASSEVPADRWDGEAYRDGERGKPGKSVSSRGSFLQGDIRAFDAAFFGITEREASVLDPQQRLLLEVAWEAIQDAGWTTTNVATWNTGVFIGFMNSDYNFHLFRLHTAGPSEILPYVSTGGMHYAVANRVSYSFGCTGPSVTLDTACSSSLVAIHLACEALRTRQVRAAIAGGVQLMLNPEPHIHGSALGAMSPDGRCRAFDASANGYARGEGCGVVAMKRLTDALADGDRIWGVVTGSAVNHVGRVSGLTVPNAEAQSAVMRAALEVGRIAPTQVGYIETHGTGTRLGDTNEVTALNTVFGGERRTHCAIGSLKTNIGHLEAGAGVASVIKVLLALRHRQLPPSIHFKTPNPLIPFDEIPLRVQTTLGPWPTNDYPLIACVNSFGLAGTNAHVVVSEPPRAAPASEKETDRRPQVLMLSAKTVAALDEYVDAYAQYLETGVRDGTWSDVCFTSSARSTHHKRRLCILGGSLEELAGRARAAARGEDQLEVCSGVAGTPVLAMAFTGEGPQWWGMGRELFASEPLYRDTLERCDELAKASAGISVLEELNRDEDTSRLGETSVAHVALFALQVSLAALWRSWGVEPVAVVGHGVGEVAAAHVAGVLSLEDAIELVVERGRSLQQATGTAEPLTDVYRRLSPGPGTMAIASTVTGDVRSGEEFDGKYWGRQAREPVLFVQAIESLAELGIDTFLEVGPDSVLGAAILQTLESKSVGGLALASLRRGSPERRTLLVALAKLHCHGYPVDWSTQYRTRGRVVSLPAYPWQKSRYWTEGPKTISSRRVIRGGVEHAAHPLLQLHVEPSHEHDTHVWETLLDLEEHAYLRDHVVHGLAIAPVTLWIVMALAAAREAFGDSFDALSSIVFLSPLTLAPRTRLQIVMKPSGGGGTEFLTSSRRDTHDDAPWQQHAKGRVVLRARTSTEVGLDTIRKRCPVPVDVASLYATFDAVGIAYGPSCQPIRALWRGESEALAEVVVDVTGDAQDDRLDAALLDAALQTSLAASGPTALWLPFEIGRVAVRDPGSGTAWVNARTSVSTETDTWVSDITIADATGAVVAEMSGVLARRVDSVAQTAAGPADAVFRVDWRPTPAASKSSEGPTGRWLVVADAQNKPFAAALKAAMRETQATCERVTLDGLEAALPADHVIVCCAAPGATAAAALRATTDALSVVQLVTAKSKQTPRMWWLTQRAVGIADKAPVEPAAASVGGLVRTVATEHPELQTVLVDVDTLEHASAAFLDAVAATDKETHVAYRDGTRYVARLVNAAVDEEMPPPSLRTDGSFLITGGFGALGLSVAKWLAKRQTRHLVLTSRRGLDSPGAIEAVAELEALGARVTVAALDVADRGALERLLTGLPGEFPLRGVVHAEGILDDCAIADQTAKRFLRTLTPKVAGAWNLHELVVKEDLDFFVLFSSVSGTVGAAAKSTCAAANAYLDALAAHRRSLGLPAISLAWGPWQGSAAVLAQIQAQCVEGSFVPLSSEQGLTLLEHALHRPEAQLVVAPLLLGTLPKLFGSTIPSLWRALVRPPAAPPTPRAPDTKRGWLHEIALLPAGSRREAVLEGVRAEVGRALALSDLDDVLPDRPLRQLGLNSLAAVELRNAFGKRTGLVMPATLAFDHPTAAALTTWLLTQLPGQPSQPERAKGPDDEPSPASAMMEDSHLAEQVTFRSPRSTRDLTVVTGANGFLGLHVAHAIANAGGRVVAVVRAENTATAQRRFAEAAAHYRLSSRSGIDALALSDSRTDLHSLLSEADTVIHCAASHHHVLRYHEMREHNVGLLRDILAQCAAYDVPRLHFMSSHAAFIAEQSPIVEWDLPLAIPQADSGYGYFQTKWVGEHLIADARRRGLQATSWRLPWICGGRGVGLATPNDAVSSFLSACYRLKAIPRLPGVSTDFAPVDFIAASVAKLTLERIAPTHALHFGFSTSKVSEELLKDLLGFDVVEPEDWTTRLSTTDHPFRVYPWLPFPRLPTFVSTLTKQLLSPPEDFQDELQATALAARAAD